MLVFEGVSHSYNGTQSVSDISFNVSPGEVLTLLGPSGCGKTSLLRLAAGLEVPTAGRILLNEQEISSPTYMVEPEDRGIGLVFQSYALFPHLTVMENVIFGVRDKGHAALRRGLDMLADMGIEALADMYPHELSGGQQQRVALARALAPKPPLILLDVPFSGLDSRLRERVRDQMLHVLKERSTAALMVTHDAEEAMFMSDRILVVNNGRQVQQGRPIELYTQPASGFVAEFFGEVNRIPGQVQNGSIATVFGNFKAADLPHGAAAEIVIRDEALKVLTGDQAAAADGAEAVVMESYLLGRASLLHLSVPTGSAELHLHARLPGMNALETGTEVKVQIDPERAFVFLDEQ